MSDQRDNLLRFEGFFMGFVGVGGFAILASTLSGREPDTFLFSVMPWVMVVGAAGHFFVRRAIRRLKLTENG